MTDKECFENRQMPEDCMEIIFKDPIYAQVLFNFIRNFGYYLDNNTGVEQLREIINNNEYIKKCLFH